MQQSQCTYTSDYIFLYNIRLVLIMLGEKIKFIRKELKMSQQAFAEYSSIPKTTLARIETGEVEYPRIDVLLKLMKLGYSPEYLLLEEKEHTPTEEILKNMPEDKQEVYKLLEKALNKDSSAIDGLIILLKSLKSKK